MLLTCYFCAPPPFESKLVGKVSWKAFVFVLDLLPDNRSVRHKSYKL